MSAPDDPRKLAGLEPNWDTYGAKPTTEAAIAKAELLRDNLCFVPMNDGGVQIEVHAAGVEMEVEIGPDGSFVSWWFAPAADPQGSHSDNATLASDRRSPIPEGSSDVS